MPYNLLLIPIIAGYIILEYCELYRYNSQRLTAQRLIFKSILAGIILSVITFILRWVIMEFFPDTFGRVSSFLDQVPLNNIEYSGTLSVVLLIAVIFTFGFNFIYWIGSKLNLWHIKSFVYKAVAKHGDELDVLFKESSDRANPFLVQVTLKNGKVYVGFIDDVIEPSRTNYASIYPVMSGYRDSETKRLYFTTQYDLITHALKIDQGEVFMDVLRMVIKQDEILTAHRFDPDIYDRFQQTHKT